MAQGQIMDESVYDIWNRISKTQVSDDGQWVSYEVGPEDADGKLKIYSIKDTNTYSFDRGTMASFCNNQKSIAFLIKPHKDSITLLKSKKVTKKDLPKDTLAIYSMDNNFLDKIPNVKSFKVSADWDDYLVYHLAAAKKKKEEKIDSSLTQIDSIKIKPKKKIKKEGPKTGTRLIVRNLNSDKEDTLAYVKQFTLAKKSRGLAAISTGLKKDADHVSTYNFSSQKWEKAIEGKGKYSQLSYDEQGKQLMFIADRDTTDALQRPNELYMATKGRIGAKKIADINSNFLPKGWIISAHNKARFSEDGKRVLFEIKAPDILQDTSLLDNEIVNVEVWNSTDGLLHTQQKVRLSDEQKKGYDVLYQINQNIFTQLEDEQIDNVRWDAVTQGKVYIGIDNSKYLQNISWLGYTNYDVYTVDPQSGKKKNVLTAIDGYPSLSPHGKYVSWYSRQDSSWMAYDLKKNKTRTLTSNKIGKFYDETNDRPMLARSNGSVGWTEDDKRFYIYDRYDIWEVDPSKNEKAKRITQGREQKIRYRNLRLDREEKYIFTETPLLLYGFNETDKSGSYVSLNLKDNNLNTLLKGNYRYSTRPIKAKNANSIVFTQENFETFPDLYVSSDNFKTKQAISDANPQQKDYRWGTIELMDWTATDGMELQGLLVKPDDFDPSKKYPLLVNFYERSSDGLNRHRAPAAGRSSINYSFYVNKGYIIFNPDVYYTDGYPGKSCENAVLSGIEALVSKGYIDKDRIGIQGHSWGGYQVAHLLTKTDIFTCAESGAPVVNMVSAYGGIRWRTGMSRMFQYEKTQSRLGATLWERPDLYLENSPIFNTDKVTTPVLILHNDKDGAVPWYQGIEYFVALRRLGKPAWMLNYNGEPHWPVKRQNRVDFQTRMAQFFDYYLMDAPKPQWMENGVSALNKGINQGLEYVDDEH